MSLEQVILQNIIKERLISEVSRKYNIPLEICNMIYDYTEENKNDNLKNNTQVPKRTKFKNGDIFDPNITPNEKPFYNMILKK